MQKYLKMVPAEKRVNTRQYSIYLDNMKASSIRPALSDELNTCKHEETDWDSPWEKGTYHKD